MRNLLILIFFVFMSKAWSSDPMFIEQWGLLNQGQKVFRTENDIRREEVKGVIGQDIDWPGLDALSHLGQGREVIVAVIDSGMDMTHPEFKDRLYQGVDFLDGAVMIDDIGHGTHVAGIIAANADGSGVQGVTPNGIKILPLKVINKDITSFVYKKRMITDIIANAIGYAVNANVSVINMSLGWPQLINTPKIIKALNDAAEKGIIIVAAAGNNNKDVPTWPCSHVAVICVGAMNNEGRLTDFSNHGGKVDLVAPGEWIVSTYPRALESRSLRKQGFEAKNGSSQAAPFVSAAAALIRLQNPDISAQEIKARLYASARKMTKDQDQRFVRFGALSLSGALAMNNPVVASVLVKDLVTVGVNAQGDFNFSLPLEVLGTPTAAPEVSLSGLKAQVSLQHKTINVSGKLPDLNVDSEILVNFKVRVDGKETQTSTTLSFARTLVSDDFINVNIDDIPAGSLIQQGTTKSSRLNIVSVEDESQDDFHAFLQQKVGNDIQVMSLRTHINQRSVIKTSVVLADHHQLLTVFEKDINFDGKSELIFYGMNTKRDHLTLTITDLSGKNAFGAHSRWELPISTFEGLPIKEGEKADFSWIKVKTFLGEILVPYYQKSGVLPELDNSRSLLHFEPNGISERLYYWEPFLEKDRVIVRPRVVDSVVVKADLRKKLNAKAKETLKLERIIHQTTEEKKKGSVRHLISVGDGFARRFGLLTVSSIGTYKLEDSSDQDSFLAGASVLAARRLEDNSVSSTSFFMTLMDRSSARVKPLSPEGISRNWTLTTSGWNNPFFEIVANFEGDDRRVLIFESRYHVYLYEQNNEGKPTAHRLPINRDSSFPGVNFSETLQGALIRMGDENQPGVAVNSTLIFGDRLYTMVSNGVEFIRPVNLSISIPKNCVPVRTRMMAKSLGHSAYIFLCHNGTTSVSLGFHPLKLN